MTDQELLQAIGQVVESKIEPLRQDIKRLETKMEKLENRMDSLEAKVDKLEARMDSLEARVSKLEGDVLGIRVYMETDQKRTLNLLLEGQQALWDRFVAHEDFAPVVERTEVLELTAMRHSQEIRELQLQLA